MLSWDNKDLFMLANILIYKQLYLFKLFEFITERNRKDTDIKYFFK